MKSGKVNERILEAIRKKSGDDESIQNFLIEMIYEEATNPGHFRDLYKSKINEYVIKESREDED